MLRIVPLIESLQKHLLGLENELAKYFPPCCPRCGLSMLRFHGTYDRKADRDGGQLNPVAVPRFRCPPKAGCGRTCSRLPSCIAPRRWWNWAKQSAVLAVMLAGGSVSEAARQTGRARSTVARWWGWLGREHQRYALHLLTHCAEWGRTSTWQAFWQRAMADEPLSELMASLDGQGVVVP